MKTLLNSNLVSPLKHEEKQRQDRKRRQAKEKYTENTLKNNILALKN